MWREQRRTTAIALAAALALGGCTSGSGEAGTLSPLPSSEPQFLDVEDGSYVFLLNNWDLKQDPLDTRLEAGVVVAWHDVNTFTLDLRDSDGCTNGAWLQRDGTELTFIAHLGGNVGSVDVNGEPAIVVLWDCASATAWGHGTRMIQGRRSPW